MSLQGDRKIKLGKCVLVGIFMSNYKKGFVCHEANTLQSM